MTGTHTHGGQRLNAGRRSTGLRPLAEQITNLFEILPQNHPGQNLIANDIHVYRCGECGVVSWDDYEITAIGTDGKAIKTYPVNGHKPAHRVGCKQSK